MTDILKERLPSPQNLGRAPCKLWGRGKGNFFHEKSHPLTSLASEKKKPPLSYESKFSRHMRWKVRFRSVYVLLTKIFGSKMRVLFFLLIIFVKVGKKIRLRLTKIAWAVELSGKTVRSCSITEKIEQQSDRLGSIDFWFGFVRLATPG